MFMGSLPSAPTGSGAVDDDDDDDDEALILGECVGSVHGGRFCSGATLRPLMCPSLFLLLPASGEGSLHRDWEELCDPRGVEVAGGETVASLLVRRGVRRMLLLSEDMALRLALSPRIPLPCLEEK